jgi:uncharacterized RDD family membrane protein YckC
VASQVAPGDAESLVVATPERVTFRLETAGLGSRFVAQLVDDILVVALLGALAFASLGLATLVRDATVPLLLFILLGFVIFWGYFIVSEAVWSGRTLGKMLLHLRVVDVSGGPLSVGQAIVRNLLRIVDFLPSYYAVGLVAIFVSARNQRLGDLAAGTVVVRERAAVRLQDLPAAPAPPPAAPTQPIRAGAPLEPRLRRFVVAYAQRRPSLTWERRAQLASEVEPALRAALPDVVAAQGPLAALDQLADSQL